MTSPTHDGESADRVTHSSPLSVGALDRELVVAAGGSGSGPVSARVDEGGSQARRGVHAGDGTRAESGF